MSAGGVPVLVLVTPGTVGTPPGPTMPALLAHLVAWVKAGVDVIQIREPHLADREIVRLARTLVARAAGAAVRVVVNDRPDIALAAGVHGVHLKDDAAPARRLRSIGPPAWLVGRSVHDREGALRAAADGVDYLCLGHVFATASKPGRTPIGLDGLRHVATAVSIPVVAIGGVRLEDAPALAAAGARGLAGIRTFDDDGSAPLEERTRRVRSAFDSGQALI